MPSVRQECESAALEAKQQLSAEPARSTTNTPTRNRTGSSGCREKISKSTAATMASLCKVVAGKITSGRLGLSDTG